LWFGKKHDLKYITIMTYRPKCQNFKPDETTRTLQNVSPQCTFIFAEI